MDCTRWYLTGSDTTWKVSVFGVCLACIFPQSYWIRRNTDYLSVFSPNAGKYKPEKLQIQILSTRYDVWHIAQERKIFCFGRFEVETTFELDKSNHPELFCQKGGLRSFAKLTGKHLYLRTATLLKKRLWHRRFPVKFAVFLRIPFFKEHLWWLLLTVSLVVASKPNDDHLC